jgi:1,4-alpha-glucan branching enzyme
MVKKKVRLETKKIDGATKNLPNCLLTDFDIYHFKEGTHYKLYDKLGAHLVHLDGQSGTYFTVWAPNAAKVSVLGDFNNWDSRSYPLNVRWDGSGIWECFVPGILKGEIYKFQIESKYKRYKVQKSDPFAFYSENPPKTASIVWDLEYSWNDSTWMSKQGSKNSLNAPISIYELHLGSWRRVPGENNRPLNYRELAKQLPEYLKELGFTHVEILPIMEHPFNGSWGYQLTGYFTPTSRYGTPQDFMFLIDCLHQNNIGVILDWVPSHFTTDEHGLGFFDGTHLYEHADEKKGLHPEWKSNIFNYGRNEIQEFLISSAQFWLDKYHIDGLRVDAVASMLYLDYSRKDGEWIPNVHGGRENLEAIEFLKKLNEQVYMNYPNVQTIAEESTAWPMVSKPVYLGGLGFGLKWDMGWMHDSLEYFCKDPVHRKFHHNKLTFRMLYANSENFVLPLSHDEVVHSKGSLLSKMPGDDWQKFANLRTLFGYMYGQLGKKLLFMGGELGQWNEWNHDSSLDWHLLDYDLHKGLFKYISDINHLYTSERAMHELDCNNIGFEWIDCNDSDQSILSFIRLNSKHDEMIMIICNFTPVPRLNYRLGVPVGGIWREILNSDSTIYGGSGAGNFGHVEALPIKCHGKKYSISITLPPLSVLYFKIEV